MTFRLDVKEAEKDIEATKKKVEAEKARGSLTMEVPHKKRGTASDSGMSKGDHEKKTFGRKLFEGALNRVSSAAGLKSNEVSSAFQRTAGAGASALPKGAGGAALGAAGTVAAGYAIISGASKILPEAYALGNELAGTSKFGSGGDANETIMRTLMDFKTRVDKLETLFTSIKPAFDKTTQFTEAARRLTGQMPDSLYYYKQNYEVERERQLLDKKFETWRKIEAPLNTAYTFADMMRRSMTR